MVSISEELVEISQSVNALNLSDKDTISSIIENAILSSSLSHKMDESFLPAFSAAIANTNQVLGSEEINPTSEITFSITSIIQTDLQTIISDLLTNQIDIESFSSDTAPESLFDSLPLGQDFPDNDSDGAVDFIDMDDDNDGIADTRDVFPMNASESLDTDADGIGNNADTDDDNDGAADADDAFPWMLGVIEYGCRWYW